MVRYHVRADGSMGVCTAQEGNCPFSGEEGTKHFTNKAEAERYSEKMVFCCYMVCNHNTTL